MHATPRPFFGPWVVRATFVMAMFGWGVGFYGPPVFLHAVVQRTGWSLALVSSAVTLHHLAGALVVTRLPHLHARFGVGATAVAGAACTALGVLGWALAAEPWQLFASALVGGAGWVTMGAAAVNAAVSIWYVRLRPMALAKAYNGGSIGGVVFSPLWVVLIAHWGFTVAAAAVGLLMVLVMAVIARTAYAASPQERGQRPDGDAPDSPAAGEAQRRRPRVPAGTPLWGQRAFVTLALGMAAGLFAQIGLLAFLFSLLVPVLGAQAAGLAMGLATACAIGGRLAVARAWPPQADRRGAAALSYAMQLAGTAVLLFAGDAPRPEWLLLGVALFGGGLGNATSLPPLIAQAEFAPQDVPRVVALTVATAQAAYAFAPAVFGLVLAAAAGAEALRIGPGTQLFFGAVAAVQALALVCFLVGRARPREA